MTEYLKKLPQEELDLINLARYVSESINSGAYLVGGFVRDLILGVSNLDLDIVIEGDGIKFAEEFAGHLNAKLTLHRRFGTATVALRHGIKVDIATARKEFYPGPAHLPEVAPGSLKDDLARRDFSINAMAISLNRRDFGRLLDVFGGRQDLISGSVRVLHDLSFIDDPTRILRAVRFEKRYNFRIEPRTLKLLKQAAGLGMLKAVEPQRLRDELISMLKEDNPARHIRRLADLAGLEFISPKLRPQAKTFGLLRSMRNQVRWFMRRYSHRRRIDNWVIYFSGIIDTLSARQAGSVLKKFVFSKGEEKRLRVYNKLSDKLIWLLSSRDIKASRIFSLLEPLSYEVILAVRAKSANPNLRRHTGDFFEVYNGMRIMVSGEDLRGFGIVPGPAYRRIFGRVLNARLEGKVKTREEELSLIRKLIKNR